MCDYSSLFPYHRVVVNNTSNKFSFRSKTNAIIIINEYNLKKYILSVFKKLKIKL